MKNYDKTKASDYDKFKVGDVVLVNENYRKYLLKDWLRHSPLGTGIIYDIGIPYHGVYLIGVHPLPLKEDFHFGFFPRELILIKGVEDEV